MPSVDRDRFLEEGYLIVKNAIPPDKLDSVRKAYEMLVDRQVRNWRSGDPAKNMWDTHKQPRLNLNQAPLAHLRSPISRRRWRNASEERIQPRSTGGTILPIDSRPKRQKRCGNGSNPLTHCSRWMRSTSSLVFSSEARCAITSMTCRRAIRRRISYLAGVR